MALTLEKWTKTNEENEAVQLGSLGGIRTRQWSELETSPGRVAERGIARDKTTLQERTRLGVKKRMA
jgi:hypothetical protein